MMARYAAKLLFDWHPDPITGSRVVRLSEERIVVFPARSARASVERAKRLGKQAELRYDSGHRLHFVGILQLMRLGAECAKGEVWWEFRRRRRAKERARALVPAEKSLLVFTDLKSSNAGRSATRETNRLTSASSRRRAGRAAADTQR
jgi:hypothetical protein